VTNPRSSRPATIALVLIGVLGGFLVAAAIAVSIEHPHREPAPWFFLGLLGLGLLGWVLRSVGAVGSRKPFRSGQAGPSRTREAMTAVTFAGRSELWTEAHLHYRDDPEAVATCVHLQAVERAMRAAGVALKLHTGQSIVADCAVDPDGLEKAGWLHPPVSHIERYAVERFDDWVPGAWIWCAEHKASIQIVHPDAVTPRTPCFRADGWPSSPIQLADIERRLRGLGARIAAPDRAFPTFGRSDDDGRAHIELDSAFHWVVRERGSEIDRRSTDSLDELLFWSMEAVTFEMASLYEVGRRKPSGDTRRLLFAHQLELLGRLEPFWAARARRRIEHILIENPFMDSGPPTL